jgi:hypothetical protein
MNCKENNGIELIYLQGDFNLQKSNNFLLTSSNLEVLLTNGPVMGK